MGEGAPLAVFRPEGKSRALGLLVYGLGGTVISLSVGLLAGVLAGALIHLAAGEMAALLGGAGAGLLVLVLLVRFFIRGYRRGASAEVRLWPDRMERHGGRMVETLMFDRLASYEHNDTVQAEAQKILLRSEDGVLLEIAPPLPVLRIAPALREAAIPVMVRKVRAAIDRGEEFAFRERTGKAVVSILGGLFALAWGGFLVIGLALALWKGDREVEPRGIGVGLVFVVIGFSSMVWFFKTRGNGMVLTKTGLRRPGQDSGEENRWSEVRRLTIDSFGLRLEGEMLQRPYRLSRRAPNYLVLAPLVSELAPDLEDLPP